MVSPMKTRLLINYGKIGKKSLYSSAMKVEDGATQGNGADYQSD